MSSPPLTPLHTRHASFTSSPPSRRLSSISQSYNPYAFTPNPPSPTHAPPSRRSSAAFSPAPSRLGSSHGPRHSISGGNLADEFAAMDRGGGTLADELGGWSGGEEEDEEGFEVEEGERDSGIDGCSSPGQDAKLVLREREEEPPEQIDLLSASLEARMSTVASLATRGVDGERDDPGLVGRVTERLRDLGGQAGIESGAARLTTAQTAIATHLARQTRALTNLTSSLFSPLAPPLQPDLLEDVAPSLEATLVALSALLPAHTGRSAPDAKEQARPGSSHLNNPALFPAQLSASYPTPAHALHTLSSSTADLLRSLATLADTLHVNAQATREAGRRLRGCQAAVAGWREEEEERERAVRWIEEGGWEERLAGREGARYPYRAGGGSSLHT
ncbi:hypothetical protein EJ06DRAFT_549530 [Trichodelitschia bisporula]|uniref:Uncharacterized protein n=1 Tax=Trichodelitschia bisporula TaxID=703511 RepID=A0A6G1HU61_9PEZI|nr:hypothetical protein EJ06DRAFT_549530 [Trichodelitschia bisporula]